MDVTDFSKKRRLGRTGLTTSRIALSGGYKVPTRGVERAYHEFGINHFYWEGRKPGMGEALRTLLSAERERIILAIQSYDHIGFWLLDTARRLKEEGKIRFLGLTGHNRGFHGAIARDIDSPFDVQMVRYNAAHRGA